MLCPERVRQVLILRTDRMNNSIWTRVHHQQHVDEPVNARPVWSESVGHFNFLHHINGGVYPAAISFPCTMPDSTRRCTTAMPDGRMSRSQTWPSTQHSLQPNQTPTGLWAPLINPQHQAPATLPGLTPEGTLVPQFGVRCSIAFANSNGVTPQSKSAFTFKKIRKQITSWLQNKLNCYICFFYHSCVSLSKVTLSDFTVCQEFPGSHSPRQHTAGDSSLEIIRSSGS